MIELNEASLILGSVRILEGITLRIAAGESVAVVGHSGAGKSSLLMLLGGIERATSGRVVVCGEDLMALGESGLARWRRGRVGVVFQSFRLMAHESALMNVALPLTLAGAGREARARAAAMLEAMGLGHRLHHRPSELSGGEQQRVALARAFVVEPVLVLADEPTGNLDRATGAQVLDLLFGMKEQLGSTLVLVTHDEALAARCGRVLRLEDGRLV